MAMKLTGWIASILLFLFLLGTLAVVCFYFPTFAGQLRTERMDDCVDLNSKDHYDYSQMKKYLKSKIPKINISEYLQTKKPPKVSVIINSTAIKTVSFSRSDHEENDAFKLDSSFSYTTSPSADDNNLENKKLPVVDMFTTPNYEITTFHDDSEDGWVKKQSTIFRL